MLNTIKSKETTVKLCLQHHDVSEALEWFCSTFGFDKFALSSLEDDGAANDSTVQGKSATKSAADSALKTAGRNLLIKHSRVKDDADGQIICEIYQESDSANDSNCQGFEIKIKDDAFGGRVFTCYDLEGQVWNFGIYNP